MNPMRDKNEGTYWGEKGNTPVATAFVEKVAEGKNFLRVELKVKSDHKK